jgi:hypothetical protein
METVQVPIRRSVFEELQKLAVPLVDDTSSVIEKLIEHWNRKEKSTKVSDGDRRTPAIARPAASSIPPTPEAIASMPRVWQSARGETLPIGAKLRAVYRGKTFSATVTSQGIDFNGHLYDSPSAAGIAAKEAAGTEGAAAATNGWTFWETLDSNGRWIPINSFR